MIPSRASFVIRVTVILSAVGMLASVRVAGSPIFALELVVGVLAVFCAVRPDSHVGLVAIVLMAVHWMDAVDDVATAWAVLAAAAMCVFHVAMAAGSIGPPSADWTTAMRNRWLHRLAALVGAGAPVWLIMRVLKNWDLDSSTALLAAALFLLAIATAWVSGRVSPERSTSDTVRT